MPVATSYPGVYVQEVSSGVHTITGVGTSIGMFIGRAIGGEMFKPVQCLSYEDVVRNFSADDGHSELIHSLRMFFTNGGTNCYVMRIADKNAAPAKLTLKAEDTTTSVLNVSALGEGLLGNDIRLSVNYNTALPESTFNLEVFRWQRQGNGTLARAGLETHYGLSMDPSHPRYVETVVARDSSLISVVDPQKLAPPSGDGYSQSGYAISDKDDVTLRAQILALLRTGTRFGLSVDGDPAVLVDLSSLIDVFDVSKTPALLNQTQMEGKLTDAINGFLPSTKQIKVTLEVGPAGTSGRDDASTRLLKITRTNGDVLVTPAAYNDLAVPLMLGAAQGGDDVTCYSARRPAPTGVVTGQGSWIGFGSLEQKDFNTLKINGAEIYFYGANALTTSALSGAKMFQDSTATATSDYNGARAGVREKLGIIAAAIVAQRAADQSFEWTAEVWGNRLALIPAGGAADSATAKVVAGKYSTCPPSVPPGPFTVLAGGALTTESSGHQMFQNVRYYALGSTSIGTYFAGGIPGNPGGVPKPEDYAKAYNIIDQEVDLFNLLVLPPDAEHNEATQRKLWGPASAFCQQRRAFLLMDPPDSWTSSQKATDASVGVNSLRVGLVKDHSAVLYPRLKIDAGGKEMFVGPSGAVAGLIARIDSSRGVWKAPAGTEADLRGALGVRFKFSDGENGVMNPKGINTIRVFPNGIVNWGARTMDGDDTFGSEYKYIPIRRLALYIEESLYRGLKWVVFEPNDEPLWSQIRLNVGAFMNDLYRQGAFQGQTPKDAYFVKCDASTTTQNDRNLGIVNVVVGFAPLKPAEFVVLTLQQMAGQIQV